MNINDTFDASALAAKSKQVSTFLTAVSNRKRLLILCALAERETNVKDLADRVGLKQSPLSQHLAKLRALDLVATRRDGQSILYRIASCKVIAILKLLESLHRP
jgi:ArsR family transcriptional regulator, virulence genes transcriptional regulator